MQLHKLLDAKKENKNDNKATENKTTSEATSSSNAGSISQGDGSAHGIVAGIHISMGSMYMVRKTSCSLGW